MNIRGINIEIVRTHGKPLFYAINRLTMDADRFAVLSGLATGVIEADRIKQRQEKVEARQRRLAKAN